MTEANSTIKSQLEEYVGRLRERAATLEKELAETRAQIRNVEETLRGLDATHEPSQSVSPGEWGCDVDDIKSCRSVRDALVKMALLNDGVLKPTPAADLLMKAGLTGGTVLANVTAGIYARVKDRPEWLHSGRGEFRYLGASDRS